METIKARVFGYYKRYERFASAGSFVAGTLFDIVTLGRIDALASLIKQALYLFVVLTLLVLEVREGRQKIAIKNPKLAKIWPYREEAMHFLLGSLLSSYTLFYFRSSSFLGSLVFFVIITACLVGNELSVVRKLGLALRTALFCLCFTSYLFCVVPIVWHSIGLWQFLTALALSLLAFASVYFYLLRRIGAPRQVLQHVALPYVGVLAAFLALYAFRLLPPIPLSLTHIGIYRNVEKVAGGYKVSYTKPSWRFWETGDQTFRYKTGERIYCFFSVFSPGGFHDSVKVRWLRFDDQHGWQPSDAVPVAITGGSDHGWRGYAYKANYQPGDWQVRIETTDAREIGRIYLSIVPEDEGVERATREQVI